jgi:hypothetical protein
MIDDKRQPEVNGRTEQPKPEQTKTERADRQSHRSQESGEFPVEPLALPGRMPLFRN